MNSKLAKITAIVAANLVLFFIVDTLFGLVVGVPPEFMNTDGEYSSNYRDYFIEKKDMFGRTSFTVDKSQPVNLTYQNEQFEPGSLKVLAVGDSFTAGQGVKPQDTWIKQLEKLSPNRLYGINYGISGLNIKEINGMFNAAIKEINPDLVVYAYVLNDPIVKTKAPLEMDLDTSNQYAYKDAGLYDDLINFRTTVFDNNRNEIVNLVYKSSNMAKYLIRTLERKKITERTIAYYQQIHDPAVNAEGLEETFKLIEQMKDESLKKHSQFVVMIFPLFYKTQKNYPFKAIHQYLRNELSKRKIDSLDLLPVYEGINDSDLWVHPVDQHPNDYAQGIAAKALSDWMTKTLTR